MISLKKSDYNTDAKRENTPPPKNTRSHLMRGRRREGRGTPPASMQQDGPEPHDSTTGAARNPSSPPTPAPKTTPTPERTQQRTPRRNRPERPKPASTTHPKPGRRKSVLQPRHHWADLQRGRSRPKSATLPPPGPAPTPSSAPPRCL